MKFSLLGLCLFFVFSCAGQTPERTENEARQLIDSLYTQLVNGADFTILADTYSEDPGSRGKGGKYLNRKKGTFVPEFEEAILKLNVGDLSPPFKTEFGYHVVQLLARDGQSVSVRHLLIKFRA